MSIENAYVLDTKVLVDALLFKNSFGRRAFDSVRAKGTLVLIVLDPSRGVRIFEAQAFVETRG